MSEVVHGPNTPNQSPGKPEEHSCRKEEIQNTLQSARDANTADKNWNKSRRSGEQKVDTNVSNFIVDDDGNKFLKPKKPEYMEYGEYAFLFIQCVCIIIYATCATYDDGMTPDTNQDVSASGYDKHRDVV